MCLCAETMLLHQLLLLTKVVPTHSCGLVHTIKSKNENSALKKCIDRLSFSWCCIHLLSKKARRKTCNYWNCKGRSSSFGKCRGSWNWIKQIDYIELCKERSGILFLPLCKNKFFNYVPSLRPLRFTDFVLWDVYLLSSKEKNTFHGCNLLFRFTIDLRIASKLDCRGY